MTNYKLFFFVTWNRYRVNVFHKKILHNFVIQLIIYTFVYRRISIRVRMWVCIGEWVCTPAYVSMCVFVYVNVCTCMYISLFASTYVSMCVCEYFEGYMVIWMTCRLIMEATQAWTSTRKTAHKTPLCLNSYFFWVWYLGRPMTLIVV